MAQFTVDPSNDSEVKQRFREYYAWFWDQPSQTGDFEIDQITSFQLVQSPSSISGYIQPVPNENTYQWDIDYSYTGTTTGTDTRRFYYKATGEYASNDWGRFAMTWPSPEGATQLQEERQRVLEREPADTSLTFEQLYDNTQSGDPMTPFKTFEKYGTARFGEPEMEIAPLAWRPLDADSLFLDDKDLPGSAVISAGVLLEIKDGAWVRLKIKTQDSNYFNPLGASMSLDDHYTKLKLTKDDPSFQVTMYEGGLLAWDIDGQWGLSALGDFYLQTGETKDRPSTVLPALDPVDDESLIKLMDWGWDPEAPSIRLTRSPPPPPPPNGEGTDPFSTFDGLPVPFEESDGLITRLLNTFTFAVNSSARAIEAVIEGAMMALPAVIVIGSAVIAAKLIIQSTDKGAEKVLSFGKRSVKMDLGLDELGVIE